MGAETNQKLKRKNKISAEKEYSKTNDEVNHKKTVSRDTADCHKFQRN
jgi:hypothetical protein